MHTGEAPIPLLANLQGEAGVPSYGITSAGLFGMGNREGWLSCDGSTWTLIIVRYGERI